MPIHFRTLLAAPALLALHACGPVRHGHPSPETRISSVRSLAPGELARVEGVVTVASGTYDGGFAIQDGSAGIYVLAPRDSARFPAGTRVQVAGAIANPNGQLAIDPQSVRVMGTDRLPAPRDVRTGAVGESDEGLLIRVRGRVMAPAVNDAPWGLKLMLNDGSGPLLVFVDTQSGMDASGIGAGELLEVTGFSGQYDEHYEILPRTQTDLRRLPGR